MVLFHHSVDLKQENNQKLGKNTEIKVFHIENRFLVKCHETVANLLKFSQFISYLHNTNLNLSSSLLYEEKVTDLRNFWYPPGFKPLQQTNFHPVNLKGYFSVQKRNLAFLRAKGLLVALFPTAESDSWHCVIFKLNNIFLVLLLTNARNQYLWAWVT